MLSKIELISELKKNGRNEVALSKITNEYSVIHESEEPGICGYIGVTTTNGNISIPYNRVDPENGYEQLILNRAKKLTRKQANLFVDYLIRSLRPTLDRLGITTETMYFLR